MRTTLPLSVFMLFLIFYIFPVAAENAPRFTFLKNRKDLAANTYLLSEFLNELDGLSQNRGVLTILTANNPEILDEAVKNRPKRFDVMIELPNPEDEQRREIIPQILTKYMNKDMEAVVPEISKYLVGFSSAHVKEFAKRLMLNCIYKSEFLLTYQVINEELQKFGFKPVNRTVGFEVLVS